MPSSATARSSEDYPVTYCVRPDREAVPDLRVTHVAAPLLCLATNPPQTRARTCRTTSMETRCSCGGPDCQPVAAAVPNADDAGIAAGAAGRRFVVTSTCDQGRH